MHRVGRVKVGTSGAVGPRGGCRLELRHEVRRVREPVEQRHAAKYDWLQFGGDSRHGGNNTLESQITQQNVSGLQQLFQIHLPETIEGAPVVLTNVSTPSGVHDIAYVATRSGYIVALDAYTGATIWSAQPASTNITMSSPAINPSLPVRGTAPGSMDTSTSTQVGTGTEVTSGGWPDSPR